jgi:hypothetical protein
MNIKHIETQHYTQDDDTIDWFDIDGETYGLNKKDGEFRLIDCDGCPVDLPHSGDMELIDAMSELTQAF